MAAGGVGKSVQRRCSTAESEDRGLRREFEVTGRSRSKGRKEEAEDCGQEQSVVWLVRVCAS